MGGDRLRKAGQIPIIVVLRVLVFFVGLFIFLSGFGGIEAEAGAGIGEILEVMSQWANSFARITGGLIAMVLGIYPQAFAIFLP